MRRSKRFKQTYLFQFSCRKIPIKNVVEDKTRMVFIEFTVDVFYNKSREHQAPTTEQNTNKKGQGHEQKFIDIPKQYSGRII